MSAEWRKSIIGMEGSIVGLEDDGKQKKKKLVSLRTNVFFFQN